jgi:hypothetical protein
MRIKQKRMSIEEMLRRISSVNDIEKLAFINYRHINDSPGYIFSDKIPFSNDFLIDIDSNYFYNGAISNIKRDEHYLDLGLTSLVTIEDDSKLHIPMVDFKCPISTENLIRVAHYANNSLDIRAGFLVNSGRSYHVYGYHLISEYTWAGMINKLLESKDDDLVDTTWALFQRNYGLSILRVSESKNKLIKPKIVAEFY